MKIKAGHIGKYDFKIKRYIHIQMYFFVNVVSMVEDKYGTFIGKCDFNINVKSNRCTEMLAWERLIQAMLSVNVILKSRD